MLSGSLPPVDLSSGAEQPRQSPHAAPACSTCERDAGACSDAGACEETRSPIPDREQQRAVNRAALADLRDKAGLTLASAERVVRLIIAGKVRGICIDYTAPTTPPGGDN
jgi:hypothetical protein